MSEDGIIQEFRESMAGSIQKIERKMGQGGFKTLEDYKAGVAEIKAYKRAIDEFGRIISSYYREEGEINHLDN